MSTSASHQACSGLDIVTDFATSLWLLNLHVAIDVIQQYWQRACADANMNFDASGEKRKQ